MIRNKEEFPEINKRIMGLIESRFFGNVTQFAHYLGLKDSTKINRLFKRDKRNNEYPMPSTDIIIMICNSLDVSADWILFGKEEKAQHVNNITIGANKISGENNQQISNSNVSGNLDYNDIIKEQQGQINTLLKLLQNGR